VSVAVAGGSTVTVPWTQGMNVQAALELARDQDLSLTFALQYFGSKFGYLVAMINESYDTFASSAAPFFYWELSVNASPSSQGIDQTILNSGDAVEFEYIAYDAVKHADSSLAIKHEHRSY